ncbi:hypothetical protein [Pseudanabaena sp. PCC 6802]|uniref:hypothetical protein n=1 Tax=Pseudanabaena sp. PCC 6802 TaxID=118173 RepID=UPI0003454E62|nr:hypothetical protein [Pseudanabaena sp. PCC 6802]
MPRPAPKFTVNLAGGSVAIAFSLEAANILKAQIAQLMESLRQVASKAMPDSSGGKNKPVRHPNMEYQHTGEVFLEIFCNPNLYASPFAAKVGITLRDDRIRLVTEAQLSQLIDDVNKYIEDMAQYLEINT